MKLLWVGPATGLPAANGHERAPGTMKRYCDSTETAGAPPLAGIAASVIPDNIAAKREVRIMKVKQKVSGCLRIMSGAEMLMRIRSYMQTARKQGMAVFQVLTDLFAGRGPDPA